MNTAEQGSGVRDPDHEHAPDPEDFEMESIHTNTNHAISRLKGPGTQ